MMPPTGGLWPFPFPLLKPLLLPLPLVEEKLWLESWPGMFLLAYWLACRCFLLFCLLSSSAAFYSRLL
jgi:hypothetical protein